MSDVRGLIRAEAALGQSQDKSLQAAAASESGGSTSSSNFRQQASAGEATAGHRIASSRFSIIPGFFGAASAPKPQLPVSDLDLLVLYAKTAPFGEAIAPRTWQADRDPIFIWEPPPTGPDLAGYSYAVDGTPDDTVDTAGTSFDVSTAPSGPLADGTHTFTVKAINTLGNAGKPISIEIWVDTTPPQILATAPAAAAVLNAAPTVTATVTDAHSGAAVATSSVSVNGTPLALSVDEATGTLSASGAGWAEGSNTIELRVADAVGNAQTPLIWSIILDTIPPQGTVTVNGGAAMTTSVYVTLELEAEDATSGLGGLLISNDALGGYVQEPFAALRELWMLTPVRGIQTVYVKFVDKAGNVSEAASDAIELALLSPETVITSGPSGFTPAQAATFTFMCPEGGCVFSYAFDTGEWSEWSEDAEAEVSGLAFGNHYFRVKAAKDVNGEPGIQADEEDPSAAERAWVVGIEPSVFSVPKGPHIKLWRLE
jgi:hypothetical protein